MPIEEEEEEDGQMVSLGDSRIEHVHGHLSVLKNVMRASAPSRLPTL